MVGELDTGAELHCPPLRSSEPRKTRRETSDRYSSFFRKSESKSGIEHEQ